MNESGEVEAGQGENRSKKSNKEENETKEAEQEENGSNKSSKASEAEPSKAPEEPDAGSSEEAGKGTSVFALKKKLKAAEKREKVSYMQLKVTLKELKEIKEQNREERKEDGKYNRLQRLAARKVKEETQRLKNKYDQVVDFLKHQLEERDLAHQQLVKKVLAKEEKLEERERLMSVAFHSLGIRLQQLMLQYTNLVEDQEIEQDPLAG